MSTLLLGLTMWPRGAPAGTDATGRRPNVVVVLVDDQGFGDLGAHGNPKVRTPNMDRFADQAVELTQFYACPVCSPSRAALLTGRYPLRSGVVDVFGDACKMKPDEVTLAQAMAGAGYATGIFGKWHLGDPPPYDPGHRGFQEVLTYRGIAPRPYFDPTLIHNGQVAKVPGYCMDIFADAAIAFVRQNKDRPFFLYLATNLIHTPLQVADAKVAPFREAGLDDTTARVWAMLQSVDDNFGRLMAVLAELGLENDTLVWFTSDNGPCTGSTTAQRYMAGLRGLKGTVYENGIRVPCYVRWPGRLKPGAKVDRIAALIDIMPTILDACKVPKPEGPALDGVSLMPLLTGTASAWPDRNLFFQWEGTPQPHAGMCFAVRNQRWKLVQAVGVADRQAHIPRKYAELCEIQGRGPQTIEGQPRLELFDIAADPGEHTDLAVGHPDIVRDLKQEYDRWFDDVWTGWQKP